MQADLRRLRGSRARKSAVKNSGLGYGAQNQQHKSRTAFIAIQAKLEVATPGTTRIRFPHKKSSHSNGLATVNHNRLLREYGRKFIGKQLGFEFINVRPDCSDRPKRRIERVSMSCNVTNLVML